ncbi:MAG: hypothetical protein ACT4OF_15200 [Caulobacteraceae bacterium]
MLIEQATNASHDMRGILSQALATLFTLGAGVGVSNAEVVEARVERVSPTSVRISWTTTALGEAVDVYLAFRVVEGVSFSR